MRIHSLFSLAALAAAACADQPTAPAIDGPSAASAPAGAVGAVFAMTNSPDGNAVVAFARGADGSLTRIGAFDARGAGVGGTNTTDPLVSQHAVIVSRDARFVFAVNAGSNTVASFANDRGALTFRGVAPSGGGRPVSLAASSRVLYALNQETNTIALLDIAPDGSLTPRDGGRRTLAGTRGAEVRLSHDGRYLIALTRGTNALEVFPVLRDGALGERTTPGPVTVPGAGAFGFDVTPRGHVVISEAGAQAASSFETTRDGALRLVEASEGLAQAAPCWLITTPDGRFAYTANAGSASISALAVGADGSLDAVTPGRGTASTGAGSSPLDLDVSRDGKFLYVLEGGSGNVMGFAIATDGTLAAIGEASVVAGRQGQMGVAVY
jgi:6-phosphogluconolactonase (cycloisomerase 2 family)